MQGDNRLFEDLARMASGAMGAFTGLRDELEARMRDHVERVLGRMNLVRREEFEAVQMMAAKARADQEALEARLAALEARLEDAPAAPRRAAAKKPPATE